MLLLGNHFNPLLLITYFFLLPLTTAQRNLLSALSFGHKTPISNDGTNIPGWTIHRHDQGPAIYSERIQLTPPYPGNKRAGMWTDEPLSNSIWEATVEFRASGPERGGGNIQFWLLKQKSDQTARASVYTTDFFDGMALVVDQYGGQGGSVRGFLNDGTVNFKARQDIDGLAFGNCVYPYRNLGRMSRMKIKQTVDNFEVTIDDQKCFESSNLQFPTGYYFGITSASAENPDAFEVAKFTVTTPREEDIPQQQQQPLMGGMGQQAGGDNQQQQQQQQQQQGDTFRRQAGGAFSPPGSSQQQQNEVFNALNAKIDTLASSLAALAASSADRHSSLESAMTSWKTTGSTESTEQLKSMQRKIEAIERLLRDVKSQVEGEGKGYAEGLLRMQKSIEETRSYIGGTLGENVNKIVNAPGPRIGFFVVIILATQVGLAASYVVYKRRRANSPKKLL